MGKTKQKPKYELGDYMSDEQFFSSFQQIIILLRELSNGPFIVSYDAFEDAWNRNKHLIKIDPPMTPEQARIAPILYYQSYLFIRELNMNVDYSDTPEDEKYPACLLKRH